MNYSSVKSSLGAVDAEKGLQASLWASTATTAGKLYPRIVGSLNYGIQLPGRHFSLWLRGAAGSSFSTKLNPFTRFGFGAFGNNYVDYQSTRQYRSPFSFPGISYSEERAVIAQRFGKVMTEFVIPPLRFKKLGGFNFFANWLQPSIFASVLYTSDERVFDNQSFTFYNKLVNLGTQIDLRMVTFSLLPSTLSVGYAKAWDLESPDSYGEFMVSVKLLH